MNSLYFSWKAIWKRRSSTIFISLIWATGLLGFASIQRLNNGVSNALQLQLENTDLLLSAKGSPTRSILANVFHLNEPDGNILRSEADELIRNYNLQNVRRIAYGDNYNGFRILGCDSATWNNINYIEIKGNLPQKSNDVIIGRNVAQKTGLKIGERFHGTHGLMEHDHNHETTFYTVSGIIYSNAPSWNRLIMGSMSSVWRAHGYSDSNYTAILARIDNPLDKLLIPKKIQEESSIMAVSPAFEVNNVLNWMHQSSKIFSAISFLFLITAALIMFFLLQSHVKERLGDYALLRALGASWWKIAKIVLWQNIILGSFAILLTYAGLAFIWFGQYTSITLDEIFQKEVYWDLSLDIKWMFACIVLSILTSIGPWIWLQRIPLHRALVDS
jgi:putative ABC transport system permease protein